MCEYSKCWFVHEVVSDPLGLGVCVPRQALALVFRGRADQEARASWSALHGSMACITCRLYSQITSRFVARAWPGGRGVARLPDCHWQLEQGPSSWGRVKPASLAGSDHYEIQGGALVARAWPSCVSNLRLELARQLRTSEIKIHKVSLPCFHLWIRLWKEISCIDDSSAWFQMWNHRSEINPYTYRCCIDYMFFAKFWARIVLQICCASQ